MRKKQTEIDYDELINRKKKEIAELKKYKSAVGGPYEGMTANEVRIFKIMHGEACIELMQKDLGLSNRIKRYFEENLTATYKRKLLGLKPIEKEDAPKKRKTKKQSEIQPFPAPTRINLIVTAPQVDNGQDKDAAKAAGALWDQPNRRWYVNEGFDLKKVFQWLPDEWKKRIEQHQQHLEKDNGIA